jgi:hypothetical protein
MPVKYSKLSAGPSTRRTAGEKTEPAASAATSLAQMTKAELVALAKHWGLPAEGTKADLILRLSE